MARRKVTLPEEDIALLRGQLFDCRAGRSPLPTEIWDGALALTQRHGLCPTARALGLACGALKTKLTRAGGQARLTQPAFLELPASRVTGAGTTI
jgi:hypothetical protein